MLMSEIRPPSHYGEWFVFQPIFHVDGLLFTQCSPDSRHRQAALGGIGRAASPASSGYQYPQLEHDQKYPEMMGFSLTAEFRAQHLSVELNIQHLCAFSVHPGFLSGCNRIRRSFTFAYPALHSGRRCQQINRGPSAIVGQSENIFKFFKHVMYVCVHDTYVYRNINSSIVYSHSPSLCDPICQRGKQFPISSMDL